MTEAINLEDEGQVGDLLAKLESGQSVKVNINGVETTYIRPPEPAPLCKKHYFVDAGKEPDGSRAAKCRSCINGRLFSPKTHQIVDGQIVLLPIK